MKPEETQWLTEAAELLLKGRQEEARSVIGKVRNTSVGRNQTGCLQPERLLRVFARDRFTCRYCGKKVIFIPLMRLLSSVFPDIFPYHRNWKMSQCHIAYWRLGASCDHVVPAARGGTNDEGNLVTACYMCNSIKQNWLLEELRWEVEPVTTSDWDGLIGCYRKLCKILPAGGERTHLQWLAELQKITDRETL